MRPPADAVVATLRRNSTGPLPRGELFVGADFLDHFFPTFHDDHVRQLGAAAERLGLALLGIDLEAEKSRTRLQAGDYRALEQYFLVGYLSGPVARLIARSGFFDAMIATKKDRSLVVRTAEETLRDVEEAVRAAGANGMRGVAIADDIAGNEGLFFSPDYFAGEIEPVYRKAAEMLKANNLYAFFHSDGNMTKAVPFLAESFDCIHPVDIQAGMDLYALAEASGGTACFMGHIDIMSWNKERIRAEIRRAEDRFGTGGVILGSSGGLSLAAMGEGFRTLYPEWDSRGLP